MIANANGIGIPLVEPIDCGRDRQKRADIASPSPQIMVAPVLHLTRLQASPGKAKRFVQRMVPAGIGEKKSAAQRGTKPFVAAGQIEIAVELSQGERDLQRSVGTVDR